MSVTIQQQLNHLINEYGPALINDPGRVKALLLDVCAANKRKAETNVLIAAAEQEVPCILYRDRGKTPANIITPRLVEQLHHQRAIDRTLAEWAVNVWRVSLLGNDEEVNTNLQVVTPKPVIPPKAVKAATPRVAKVDNNGSKPPVINKHRKLPSLLAVGLIAVSVFVLTFFEDGFSGKQESHIERLRNDALQGDAVAQFNLGVMARSSEQAHAWYRKAAEQGLAPAQYQLALTYLNGYGVEQSDEKAVDWYRKAAEQGNATAQYNLGYMYRNGFGLEQSDENAAIWYRKAAEQGNVQAQNNLGWTYESIF